MFERHDWTLFRNLSTLSQKAGVPVGNMRCLIVKELVDNALDACGDCRLSKLDDDTYQIEDDGPGIPGDAGDLARLFSVNRPMASTKVLRMPTRGALGNGLRVVVGAILASGGEIKVETRGKAYWLKPKDDGTTDVTRTDKSDVKSTRITITVGKSLPRNKADCFWANLAINFKKAKPYKGKTSPWWYDSDSFYELLQAAGKRQLSDLLAEFEAIGKIDCPACASQDISREGADKLLMSLRKHSSPVKPVLIGHVGKAKGESYASSHGTINLKAGRGGMAAEIPFVIEVWAYCRDEGDKDEVLAYVNSTPITGETSIQHEKTDICIFGCGLKHRLPEVGKKPFFIMLNITTPYMPITTDGKEPDFRYFIDDIYKCLKKAASSAKRKSSSSKGDSQRYVMERNIRRAVEMASGSGKYRFSLRQLFYALRPHVMEECGVEPSYNYFASFITDYEAYNEELPGLYRDPRGVLYHPHLKQSIPLGTINVEDYGRPEWTFNKILYCEKEGFFPILQSVEWPERNDCALLTSKGFASRAARDVLDLLGETDEEITFFCIHDADASGSLIYETLCGATRARAGRNIKIVNLGLDPWEAVEMGLQEETFKAKKGKLPVAQYVRRYNAPAPNEWPEWLQTHRVELNAMTTPQFIGWLDEKMAPYHNGKVMPPRPVLERSVRDAALAVLRQRVMTRILADNDFDEKVEKEFSSMEPRIVEEVNNIESTIRKELKDSPAKRWNAPIKGVADRLAGTKRK